MTKKSLKEARYRSLIKAIEHNKRMSAKAKRSALKTIKSKLKQIK